MSTNPSADELLIAVTSFIEQISPSLKDRDAFLARVAVNALATVRREMAAERCSEAAYPSGFAQLMDETDPSADLEVKLGIAIREGRFDDREVELLAHLKAAAIHQIKIDQPKYSGLKAALALGAPSGS